MIDIGCWPDTDEQWVVLGEKLEKKEVEMIEWIKCSDQLPQSYLYVLVANSSKPPLISIARQYKGIWEMLSSEPECNAVASGDLTWYMEPNEITYWMPLPSSPKDQS